MALTRHSHHFLDGSMTEAHFSELNLRIYGEWRSSAQVLHRGKSVKTSRKGHSSTYVVIDIYLAPLLFRGFCQPWPHSIELPQARALFNTSGSQDLKGSKCSASLSTFTILDPVISCKYTPSTSLIIAFSPVVCFAEGPSAQMRALACDNLFGPVSKTHLNIYLRPYKGHRSI